MTGDSAVARHLPIIIAFAILAAYTYQSGLRVVVAALVTLDLRAARVAEGADGTTPDDYFAD